MEVLDRIKGFREIAYQQVSSEFKSKDKRDVVFLLTLANMADNVLGERTNVHNYLEFAIKHQNELLLVAQEFDRGIENFNSTAGKYIDPKFINIVAVRSKNNLGKDGTIPSILNEGLIRPHEAISQFDSGEITLEKQNIYMKNSEMGLNDDEILKTIKEKGTWSELHLKAKSPKHFLATFMIDLYPGMVRRWLQKSGKHKNLDTDELVRALCESLDRKSSLFKLIKDQGWFVEGEFSKSFVDHL